MPPYALGILILLRWRSIFSSGHIPRTQRTGETQSRESADHIHHTAVRFRIFCFFFLYVLPNKITITNISQKLHISNISVQKHFWDISTMCRPGKFPKTHRILGISKALPLKNSKALFIRYQIAPMAMSTCSVTKAA